jgi:tetratricopeptide (TPR) repeat protein
LSVSAVAYVIMWSSGIGPVGNLVAQGVFEEGGTVVLAEFAGQGGGADLAEVVTEALRVDLQSSPHINLVPPARVASTLARMERPADSHLSGDLAREVAVRDGYSAVLRGEVGGVGSGFVLTASLVAVPSGDVLAAFRANAETEDDLLGAIDQLSQDIREKAGESLRSIRAGEPLEVVTTASLDALRLYSRGEALSIAGDLIAALPPLQEAIELDPEFAMAHRKLSVTLNNLGLSPDRAREAATRAYELRHRLTERERGITEGYYYTAVAADADRAIQAYDRMLETYPDDGIALNNLGDLYMTWGRRPEAEEVLRRALDGPFPTAAAHVNLVWTLWEMGREEEARIALVQFEVDLPEAAGVPYMELALLAAEGRWAEAHDLRQTPAYRRFTFDLTAVYDLGRGHWAEAIGHLERVEEEVLDAGQPTQYIDGPMVTRALAQLGIRGSVEGARSVVLKALERVPLDSIPVGTGFSGLARLAQISAFLGLEDVAGSAFARYERSLVGGGGLQFRIIEQIFTASAAFGSGRWEDAAEGFDHLFDDLWRCAPTCRFGVEHGLALAEAGRSEEAIRALEASLASPALLAEGEVVPLIPLALDRLARLYEAEGDLEAAAGAYARLADMWVDADNVLEPMARRARERAASLTAGG